MFSIDPGTIALTLIFLGPNSTANPFVNASIPAFAELACDYITTPCNHALILMIDPCLTFDIDLEKTILVVLNVPNRSISITVLKALVEI